MSLRGALRSVRGGEPVGQHEHRARQIGAQSFVAIIGFQRGGMIEEVRIGGGERGPVAAPALPAHALVDQCQIGDRARASGSGCSRRYCIDDDLNITPFKQIYDRWISVYATEAVELLARMKRELEQV